MTINEKKMRNSKVKKATDFDLLVVTESLGYKTYRKNRRNSWSREEDNKLKQLINTALIEHGFPGGIADIRSIQESERVCKNISWEQIANLFNDPVRKPKDLKKRWTASLDPNLKKGKWTPEEDKQLLKAYAKHGSHWQSVSENITGRTEDQCAKRYIEVLGPSTEGRLRKWTMEEDLTLVKKVKKYGTKWRRISSEMEFRPSLTCRNRWRKIITSVVRNKASPEIAEAVKGDQDVSLSSDKFGTAEEVQEDPDSEDEEQELGSSNESSGRKDEKGFDDEERRDEEASDRSGRQIYDCTNSAVLFAGGTAAVQEPMLLSESHYRQFPDGLATEEALSLKRTEKGQSNPNKSTSFPDVLEPLQTSPKLCSQEDTSAKGSIHEERQRFNENRAEARIQQKSSKKSTLHRRHMEWKFILKDGEELSVSSGVISNSELVKELIAQAKKHSLKISIHQHIHNHYSASQELGSDHQNSSSFVPDVYSHFHTNSSSPSSGDSNKDILSNANGTVKPACPGGYQDFLAGSPGYNAFELEAFPQLDGSQNGMCSQRTSQYAPHQFSPYAVRPDVPTSTRSADDLQDISRNRVSHFNYLPPTLKPQLESSNSTKASDLNVLLNPSPSNGSRKKFKKKRKRSLSGRSADNTPGSSYQGSSQASPEDKHIASKDYPKSVSSLNDDEGLDFWENLRSLAGRPTSPQEEATQTSIPFGEDNRALIYGLFNGGNDVESDKTNSVSVSYPLDSDTFIPFNPS